MNSNPFFFWVYGKCQGLVRQHILYGSINLAWRLKFKLRSKLGADGRTQRLWMAMEISLASSIHAKVGASNHCITSHYICVMSCQSLQAKVLWRQSQVCKKLTSWRQLVRLDTKRDLQVTPVASSLWYLCSRSAEFALIQYHVYRSHNMLYLYIYTHRYISSTKPKWVLVSKMAFAAPGCAAWLSGWACFVSWWAKEDPAVCQVHLSQAEEAEPLAWDSFSAGLCFCWYIDTPQGL